MADAFRGGFGQSISNRPTGIFVNIPAIPLFVAEQAKATLNRLIHSTMRLALMEVAGRVSDEAGKFSDSGQLAQSFGSDPATSAGGIEVTGTASMPGGITGRVFSTLPYAIVMELGRRAGQPISRAGIDAIGLWAQRKLGLTADDAAHVKWAIATTIIAQGIEGKHYFEDGVASATPRVEMLFKILGDQIATALLKPGAGQTGTGS